MIGMRETAWRVGGEGLCGGGRGPRVRKAGRVRGAKAERTR